MSSVQEEALLRSWEIDLPRETHTQTHTHQITRGHNLPHIFYNTTPDTNLKHQRQAAGIVSKTQFKYGKHHSEKLALSVTYLNFWDQITILLLADAFKFKTQFNYSPTKKDTRAVYYRSNVESDLYYVKHNVRKIMQINKYSNLQFWTFFETPSWKRNSVRKQRKHATIIPFHLFFVKEANTCSLFSRLLHVERRWLSTLLNTINMFN